MKKYFVKLTSRLLYSTIHQAIRYFWVFIVNSFSFYAVLFSQENCSSFGLLLIADLISLDTSGKPTVDFFLKIISPSWIILSISLDEHNSIDCSRADDEFYWNNFFYCCKRILIWQKILNDFWRLYLNIIFWILLWTLTSLVIWSLKLLWVLPWNTATRKPEIRN